MRTPKTPVDIFNLDQAATLCSKYFGVYGARRVRLVNGIKMQEVISVSFWPWTIRRDRLMRVMAVEVSTRFVISPPPPLVFMRARRVRKLQRAYNKRQKEKDRFYDAERD